MTNYNVGKVYRMMTNIVGKVYKNGLKHCRKAEGVAY